MWNSSRESHTGNKKRKAHDKDLMKKGRGAYDEIRSTGDPIKVRNVKWWDNKIVNIVSTFAKSRPVATVSRLIINNEKKLMLNAPTLLNFTIHLWEVLVWLTV